MSGIFGRLRAVLVGSVSAGPLARRNGKSSMPESLKKSLPATHDCTCSHRMTIHYYGGHGVTEYCLVPGCPCEMFERPYVAPPKPPKQVKNSGIGIPKR